MWTGRQTLVSIESAIAKLHGEEGQLDQALRSAVSDADRLRKERSQGLRELARIKLDEMTAARLVSNLDAGERRAMQILDDYRMRMAATAEQRETLLKEVAAAEAESRYSGCGSRGRARSGRDFAGASRGESTNHTRVARSQDHARRSGRRRH